MNKPKPLPQLTSWQTELQIILQVVSEICSILCLAFLLHDLFGGRVTSLFTPLFTAWFGLLLISLVSRETIEFYYKSKSLELQEQLRGKIFRILEIHPESMSKLGYQKLYQLLLDQLESLEDYYLQYLPNRKIITYVGISLVVILALLDWKFILLILATILVMLILMGFVGQRIAAKQQEQQQEVGVMQGVFVDTVLGLKQIKLLGLEDFFAQKILDSTKRFHKLTFSVLRIAFFVAVSFDIFIVVLFALLFYLVFETYSIEISSQIAAQEPKYFMAILVVFYFIRQTRSLLASYHAQKKAKLVWHNLQTEIPQILEEQETSQQSLEKLFPFGCQNLHFSLAGRELFSNLNWHCQKGDYWHIVGKSGIGKTSLLWLLLGYLQAQKGSIFIGNQKLEASLRQDWHSHLALVEQKPLVIQGSIRENLLFSYPENIPDQNLLEACGKVNLGRRIASEQDLDTILGENGQGLSKGEQQRLCLARALLKNAEILLLDEITGFLDSHTQSLIDSLLLEQNQEGKTIIRVTHHYESIAPHHRVLALEYDKDTGFSSSLEYSGRDFADVHGLR